MRVQEFWTIWQPFFIKMYREIAFKRCKILAILLPYNRRATTMIIKKPNVNDRAELERENCELSFTASTLRPLPSPVRLPRDGAKTATLRLRWGCFSQEKNIAARTSGFLAKSWVARLLESNLIIGASPVDIQKLVVRFTSRWKPRRLRRPTPWHEKEPVQQASERTLIKFYPKQHYLKNSDQDHLWASQ